MSSAPRVSVVIPTFNRADLLPQALDSVMAQTIDEWEIVLVDDGSTDATAEVVERYGRRLGLRLMVIRQSNAGSSASRNRGIDGCRGEFVCFLDSDDEFAPPKLERQLELFRRRPDLGLVYSDYAFIDLDGNRAASAFAVKHAKAREMPCVGVGPNLYLCPDDLFDRLLQDHFISTIVGMVRRQVLGNCVRFHRGLSYAEEWLFYLQVVRRCRVGFVDESLSIHHHTRGSLARASRTSNAWRRLQTIQAIRDSFRGQLTRWQRITLRRHLSDASAQVGYDLHRAGRHAEAAPHFARAWKFAPTARNAAAAVECGVRGLLGWLRPSGTGAAVTPNARLDDVAPSGGACT